MTVLGTCLATVVFVLLLLVIRAVKGELALPMSVILSVFLTGAALTIVAPLFSAMKELAAPYGEDMLEIPVKTLGISLVSVTAADFCRDAGETAIAAKLELLGKCAVLALALPLILRLVTLCREVLAL